LKASFAAAAAIPSAPIRQTRRAIPRRNSVCEIAAVQ
jgi:hypothetical protein